MTLFYFPDVRVSCVCPPIPDRCHDWQAYDDRTADEGMTIGEGETEEAAAFNLLRNMYDNGELNWPSFVLMHIVVIVRFFLD